MSSRLAQLARGAPPQRPPQPERCDLCAELLPSEHRHLLDLRERRLLCACRPCSLLFDGGSAGGGHFRLVPDRRVALEGFDLDDAAWESLRIPVDMAFLFRSGETGAMAAFYPGPMGATESTLTLEAWRDIEDVNPVLAEMEDDVEALLVNRTRGAREQWIVPVDDCYRLVGVVRGRWRGFSGGTEVWQGIDAFFDELRARARSRTGKEIGWQAT